MVANYNSALESTHHAAATSLLLIGFKRYNSWISNENGTDGISCSREYIIRNSGMEDEI